MDPVEPEWTAVRSRRAVTRHGLGHRWCRGGRLAPVAAVVVVLIVLVGCASTKAVAYSPGDHSACAMAWDQFLALQTNWVRTSGAETAHQQAYTQQAQTVRQNEASATTPSVRSSLDSLAALFNQFAGEATPPDPAVVVEPQQLLDKGCPRPILGPTAEQKH